MDNMDEAIETARKVISNRSMQTILVAALFGGLVLGAAVGAGFNEARGSDDGAAVHAESGGVADAVEVSSEAEASPTVSESRKPFHSNLHDHVATTLSSVANMTMEIQGEPWMFLVGADMGFLHMLLNTMLSLHDFGLGADVAVVCYDQEICNILAEAGLTTLKHEFYETVAEYYYANIECPAEPFKMVIEGEDGEFGPAYHHAVVMLMRVLVHGDLVDNGISFFTFDADICFRKDMRDIFIRDREDDIVITTHVGGLRVPDFSFNFLDESVGLDDLELRLNNGIASFHITDKIKPILSKAYGNSLGRMCDIGFPQAAFNRIVYDENIRFSFDDESGVVDMVYQEQNITFADSLVAEAENGLKIRTVPFTAYYNACNDDQVEVELEQATIVHANCEKSIDDKVNFLKETGCWFLRDDFLDVPRTGDRLQFLRDIDVRNHHKGK